MSSIMFLLFLVMVFVAVSIAVRDEPGALIGFNLIALLALLTLVFIVAPDVLGVGQVPDKAEEFTRRLDAGKVYYVIASHTDGADTILLVMEKNSTNYYAIRVNSGQVPLREPGYFFTLIKGQLAELK